MMRSGSPESALPSMSTLDAALARGKPGKWECSLQVGGGDVADVPLGVVVGSRPGPTALITAGIHGTELLSQDAAQSLLLGLDARAVRGTVYVVLCADVTAAGCGTPTLNPRDGQNLNRVWPGDPHGSYTERLAHALFTQLVSKADYVVDLHGGEWTEEAMPGVIVHMGGDRAVDARSVHLGRSADLSYVEVHEPPSEVRQRGTITARAALEHKSAIALEVGGGGRRDGVETVCAAVTKVLTAAGTLAGEVHGGDSLELSGSVVVRAPLAGVLIPTASLGAEVSEGEEIARIQSYGGALERPVLSPASGMVVLRSVARVVAADGLVSKIGRR